MPRLDPRELARFRAPILAALGPRVRIHADPEGWPMVPGRYGRLEWRGLEWDTGQARIYAYTATPRMIAKLRAIPGVCPKQIGDHETAFWIRADDATALQAVSALLHLRHRHPPSDHATAAHMAAMRAKALANPTRRPTTPRSAAQTGPDMDDGMSAAHEVAADGGLDRSPPLRSRSAAMYRLSVMNTSMKSSLCIAKSANGRPAFLFVEAHGVHEVTVKPVPGTYERPLTIPRTCVFRADAGLYGGLLAAYEKRDAPELSRLWKTGRPWEPAA